MTTNTANRGYQLPNPANFLDEDVLRLISALQAIDADMASVLAGLLGKAAAAHGHVINDVAGLQQALDGKQAVGVYGSLGSLSDVSSAAPANNMFLRFSGSEWIPVVFDASMIAGGTISAARLPSYLASTSLSSTYAPLTHSHAIADVAGLQAALNAKADLTSLLGKQTIWLPAPAMIPRTTNGAAIGSVETATNKVMLRTLDFDAATQEFAQFAIQMPKGWDEGTLVCQFVWSHAATATNFGVAWAIEAVAFADDDAADAAFGTAVQVTDTGGTANDIYITPETGALTVAGSPGPEEWVVFQVKRVPADAADTMAIDARLHGVKIHYTANAATDG